MRRPTVFFALSISAVLLCGCGDGDSGGDPDAGRQPDAGISVEAFTGTWQASVLVYTNNADDTETNDVIANGGEFRMAVLSGGRARTFLTVGTFEDEWDGLLTVDGTTLTSDPEELSRPIRVYEFTLIGDELTLTNDGDEFDFTESGAAKVSATAYSELTRN